MIQITNSNLPQSFYLKLDGYSQTSTDAECLIKFTCQLTGEVTQFERITPASTNGRYQKFTITPPSGTSRMTEGLYLVDVLTDNGFSSYARRLAFVSAPVPFQESTYTSYTGGDNAAYNVYTQ